MGDREKITEIKKEDENEFLNLIRKKKANDMEKQQFMIPNAFIK